MSAAKPYTVKTWEANVTFDVQGGAFVNKLDLKAMDATVRALEAAEARAEKAEARVHELTAASVREPFHGEVAAKLCEALKRYARQTRSLVTDERSIEQPCDVVDRLARERDAAEARMRELESEVDQHVARASEVFRAAKETQARAEKAEARLRDVAQKAWELGFDANFPCGLGFPEARDRDIDALLKEEP